MAIYFAKTLAIFLSTVSFIFIKFTRASSDNNHFIVAPARLLLSKSTCLIRAINQTTVLLLVWLSVFSANSAEYPNDSHIQPDEWPFLPTYCLHTLATGESLGSPSPQAQIIIAQIGMKAWTSIHHYCWGLAKIYRSHGIGLTTQERDFWLKDAISEFDYTLKHLSPNDSSLLRPELLTKRGTILLKLKSYREAEENLRDAIKIKADYWPAYGYLSDLYIELGDIEKAKSILEGGLKISPNAKGLKIRIKNLENKLDSNK